MKTLKPLFLVIFVTLSVSFGVWNYLLFTKFQVANTEVYYQGLINAFRSPPLFKLSMDALLVGLIAAAVSFLIYEYAPARRPKTKGHVRGSELLTAKKLSKMTRSEQQHLTTLAEVPIPLSMETRHFLIGGSTGSGKSVAITEMLSHLIPRRDRVVITDPNGEFLSRFYQKGDVILNPFDRRGEGWSLYNEIRSPYDFERYAKSVIPPASNPQDAEWHSYAQLLFAETAKTLVDHHGGDSMGALSEWLTKKPAEELKEILQGTAATGLFDPGAGKALASTRFIIARYIAPHQYLKPGNFSLRKFLEDENAGNLYITWREDMADALRPLISTWMDIISTSILSLKPSSTRRIWMMIDELASLERLNSLESALTKGRKHGLRVVAGLQSTKQLDDLYGLNKGVVLRSCFGNLLVLRGSASDPTTAEEFSKGLGDREIERKQKSITRNRQGVNRTQTFQRVKERIILPSEISNLPELNGFLSLASDYPIGKVQLKYSPLPEITAPFIEERNVA